MPQVHPIGPRYTLSIPLDKSGTSSLGSEDKRGAMNYRRAAQAWYNSKRWKQKRARQLAESPLCAYCLKREGRANAASIADHKIPHRGDADLFWNGALQSLCKRHHDSDKQQEDNGKVVTYTGLDGWPT